MKKETEKYLKTRKLSYKLKIECCLCSRKDVIMILLNKPVNFILTTSYHAIVQIRKLSHVIRVLTSIF